MIIRPSNFVEKLIEFNCASRSKTANKRFIHSINKEEVCENGTQDYRGRGTGVNSQSNKHYV